MDLPPPPKEMLAEAEKEEAIYMREMLEKVLTIKEAKCIKLAIWEKIHRHPIVQGIFDLCDIDKATWDDGDTNPIWLNHVKKYYKYKNPRFLKEIFRKEIYRKRAITCRSDKTHHLKIFKDENCRYLRGKKKGGINEKWWELAGKIYFEWRDAIDAGIKGEEMPIFNYGEIFSMRPFTIDELYRLGFWNFMLLNHKHNRNKAKWEWNIRMF